MNLLGYFGQNKQNSYAALKLIEINGFIEERHNSKLLHVQWSTF